MRQTYSQQLWPTTADFAALLRGWQRDASAVLVGYIWQGYDRLHNATFSALDVDREDADIERDITQLLEPAIRQSMSGFEPFYIQHGPYEFETRQPPPAQPPQYDLAFVWSANPRVQWPLEAKVLRTAQSTSEYIKALTDNFLTCRYAPFSSEAGMLGYLLQGLPENVLEKIAQDLSCTLMHHPFFPDRNHRTSDHDRIVPQGKAYPSTFHCHHIILVLRSGT